MFIITELVVKLARVYYDSQVFIRDLHSRKNRSRNKNYKSLMDYLFAKFFTLSSTLVINYNDSSEVFFTWIIIIGY